MIDRTPHPTRTRVQPRGLEALTAAGFARAGATTTAPTPAHPLAAMAYRVLRDRPEADRRLVYEACRRRRAPGPCCEREELSLHALELVKAHLGHAPSRREYDLFRGRQPDPRAWPSATYIRKTFGGWGNALAALGEPMADVLAHRLISQPAPFTREELLGLIRSWVEGEEPRVLRQKHFLAWCRAVVLAGGRAPRASETLRRHVGDWEQALLDAGLAPSPRGNPPASSRQRMATAMRRHRAQHPRPTGRGPVPRTGAGLGQTNASEPSEPEPSGPEPTGLPKPRLRLDRVPATQYSNSFSRELLLEWLEFWTLDLDPSDRPGLTQDQFDRLALMLSMRGIAEGQRLYVPRTRAFTRCFGSWPETKMAAGWMDAQQAVLQPSRENYSTDQLVEWLVAALLAIGRDMTVRQYRRWRLERLTELAPTDPRARIPSDTLLRQRFGGETEDWDITKGHFAVRAPFEARLAQEGQS